MKSLLDSTSKFKWAAPGKADARRKIARNILGPTAIPAATVLISLALGGTSVAQTAPTLGTTGPFGIVSSTFTNTDAATTVNGNVCFTTGPATAYTINGTQTVPCAAQVGLDEASALAALNGETCLSLGGGVVTLNTVVVGTNPPGTIPPGCYSSGGAINISTLATVELDGAGVYIFRSGGALGVGASSQVTMTNGADASNVFWAPSSATTFGANAVFVGTVFDAAGITFGHLAALTGRALAFGGTVSADANTITVPAAVLGTPVLFASVLPGSRAVEIPSPATIFAMMINSGGPALHECQIILPAGSPTGLTLNYQTTNPATNTLTGTANTPATIAGGDGEQSFLLSFHGTDPFTATALPLDFQCDQSPLAAIVPGVDTVDLTFSSVPIADIIALVATASDDGIIHVPTGGSAAFAVASANIGLTSEITVSVDTGAAILPVTTLICQTNSSTAQCLAAPTASVSLSIADGSTPTFSVFLHSTAAIPFAPASSRVFVRFEDAGALNGSTSVAIESP